MSPKKCGMVVDLSELMSAIDARVAEYSPMRNKATSWDSVRDLCKELGIDGGESAGQMDVLAFIRKMASDNAALSAKCERLSRKSLENAEKAESANTRAADLQTQLDAVVRSDTYALRNERDDLKYKLGQLARMARECGDAWHGNISAVEAIAELVDNYRRLKTTLSRLKGRDAAADRDAALDAELDAEFFAFEPVPDST